MARSLAETCVHGTRGACEEDPMLVLCLAMVGLWLFVDLYWRIRGRRTVG